MANFWTGGAAAVPEQRRITLGGTWAGSETITITLNSQELTLTIDSARTTIIQILDDLVDMVNGGAANGAEERSALGSEVGEFAQCSAVRTTTTAMVITGPSDGREIEISTSDTSGTGTTADSTPVTGTGPHHFDNDDNWSTGSTPTSGDIVFDYQASSSLLYELDQSHAFDSITVEDTFVYSIGLPAVNVDTATLPFGEFLTQALTVTTATAVKINSTSGGSVKINTGNNASELLVYGTGTSDDPALPPVLLYTNNNSSVLHVSGGSVGLCVEKGVAGNCPLVTVGGEAAPEVTIGDSVTLVTVKQVDGLLKNSSAITTLTLAGGIYEHYDGNITTVNMDGGLFRWYDNGTITTFNLGGGTLDASVDGRAKTASTLNIYAGTVLRDPLGAINTASNVLSLKCQIELVTLELPARKTWTVT